jgi:hypothetical protein
MRYFYNVCPAGIPVDVYADERARLYADTP